MEWKRVVSRAIHAAPEAKQLGAAVIELFEEGLRGAPTQQSLQRAYGVASLDSVSRNEFADALSEVACRESEKWRPQTLAAVRACLRMVPDLMLDLYAVFRGDKVFPTQGEGSLPTRLRALGEAGKQRWLEPLESPSGHVCPRCGYLGVTVEQVALRDRSAVEGRCPACAQHAMWRDPESGWPRVDDETPREQRLDDKEAVSRLFASRGDDPFATPTGFTIARKLSSGQMLPIEVAYRPAHRVYHVIAGLAVHSPIPEAKRRDVAVAIADINRELAVQGFVMGERIAFRTHAYTNADGSISSRVMLDTVDLVVGAVDQYEARIRAVVAA